jgi:hypothetical protein
VSCCAADLVCNLVLQTWSATQFLITPLKRTNWTLALRSRSDPHAGIGSCGHPPLDAPGVNEQPKSYSGGTCIVAVSGTAIGAGPGAGAGAGAATCGWGSGC